jgi:hypothetical protein
LSILYELISFYNSDDKSGKRITFVGIILAITFNILPLFFPNINGHVVYELDGLTYTVNLSLGLICAFFAAVNVAFMSISIVNIKRQIYMMKQLSYIITMQRANEYDEKRKFPTLNVFDTISLRTWAELRRIALDYGRKFIIRLEYGTSVQLTSYVFIGLFLAIEEIFFNSTVISAAANVVIIGSVSLFMILLIMMFNSGAKMNDIYRFEINALQ